MELSLAALLVAAGIVLCGAIVRAITGFGASLIWVGGLTLLMPADEAVPIVLLLEVAVSAQLFPACRAHVDWKSLRPLLAGAMLGAPIGIMALAQLDRDTMGLIVAIVVLAASVALVSGWSAKGAPSRPATLSTGVASGVMNGATAAGGPPVIIFFLATPSGMATSRASLIAYFGLTDIVGSILLAISGLLDGRVALRALVLAVPMLIGAAIGQWAYSRVDPERVRPLAFALLFTLGIVGFVRAF